MIKLNNQLEISFSKYNELYDILIPSENFWKQLNDMIDFSFVVDMIKDKYSSTMWTYVKFLDTKFCHFLNLPYLNLFQFAY